MLPVVTPNVSINTPTPFQLYSKTLTSHEIPCPRGIVCKNDFQIQPLFLVLTFQIKYQDPNNMTQPWNFLTNNLKDKSFRNSTEWSGLYLQMNILPWLRKFLDLLCSDYWKMYFVNLLPHWHDLIISPPINLTPKICHPWNSKSVSLYEFNFLDHLQNLFSVNLNPLNYPT